MYFLLVQRHTVINHSHCDTRFTHLGDMDTSFIQRGCRDHDRYAWQLDLQLPVQTVPIITKVVSFNPAHGEVYSIYIFCNIKFISDLQQVNSYVRVLWFPPPIFYFKDTFFGNSKKSF